MMRKLAIPAFPLILASMLVLAAPFAAAGIVINEIDYDQPGTDTAEFIELKNLGPGPENLQDYTLELVNGALGAAVYQSIPLPNVVLPAGGHFVICGNGANVPNCDLDVTPDENLVQNGAPDAVGIRRVADNALIDAVSYEGNTGAPYTEGTGTSAADDNVSIGIGISRFPDGVDTNNNNADFVLRVITPGGPNVEVPITGPVARGMIGTALALLGCFAVVSRARRRSPA